MADWPHDPDGDERSEECRERERETVGFEADQS